jgi:hypothetical protein
MLNNVPVILLVKRIKKVSFYFENSILYLLKSIDTKIYQIKTIAIF